MFSSFSQYDLSGTTGSQRNEGLYMFEYTVVDLDKFSMESSSPGLTDKVTPLEDPLLEKTFEVGSPPGLTDKVMPLGDPTLLI